MIGAAMSETQVTITDSPVGRLVGNLVQNANASQPFVTGADVIPWTASRKERALLAEFSHFSTFNRTKPAAFSVNAPSIRYFLRTPYARFLRPVTKSLTRVSWLFEHVFDRQNQLERELNEIRDELNAIKRKIE